MSPSRVHRVRHWGATSCVMRDKVVESPDSHEPAEFRKTPRKAAASGWIGSALEYYDFFLYAQAAALVFPRIFFPSENPTVGIISSLATFGVGYVMRPIGALCLGHWADTHGRKYVLVGCMLMMGASTFLMGLLPTYNQVGLLAPALLLMLRLIQGFAVAGESTAASAMILEHAPFGRRGHYGSYVLQGIQAGQLMAAGAFLPISALLSPEAFVVWGWRIPFLFSAFVVVAGYLIRRRVDESPVFRAEAAHGELPRAPAIRVLREGWRNMVRVTIMALTGVIPIVVVTFGGVYATNPAYSNGFSTTTYLWISAVGNAVALLVIPFVGSLSDRIGRRPCFIVGAIGAGALVYPYLYSVHERNTVLAFTLSILLWGVIYQGCTATIPSFYPELFPSQTRATGVALSLNIGTMVTAFLPTVFAAVAPPGSDVVAIVGSATFGIMILAALAAVTAPETYRVHMNDLGLPGAIPVPHEEYMRIRAASA